MMKYFITKKSHVKYDYIDIKIMRTYQYNNRMITEEVKDYIWRPESIETVEQIIEKAKIEVNKYVENLNHEKPEIVYSVDIK